MATNSLVYYTRTASGYQVTTPAGDGALCATKEAAAEQVRILGRQWRREARLAGRRIRTGWSDDAGYLATVAALAGATVTARRDDQMGRCRFCGLLARAGDPIPEGWHLAR